LQQDKGLRAQLDRFATNRAQFGPVQIELKSKRDGANLGEHRTTDCQGTDDSPESPELPLLCAINLTP
jgi:hypothetical protein